MDILPSISRELQIIGVKNKVFHGGTVCEANLNKCNALLAESVQWPIKGNVWA